jgi:hypothetical protein
MFAIASPDIAWRGSTTAGTEEPANKSGFLTRTAHTTIGATRRQGGTASRCQPDGIADCCTGTLDDG